MILARVMGTAVATIKHPVYQGRKVMVVQPLTPEGADKGNTFLAVDTVQAGVGDKVLVTREGNTARQLCEVGEEPIHAAIVTVVDDVQLMNA